jgi:hypothetical protein
LIQHFVFQFGNVFAILLQLKELNEVRVKKECYFLMHSTHQLGVFTLMFNISVNSLFILV